MYGCLPYACAKAFLKVFKERWMHIAMWERIENVLALVCCVYNDSRERNDKYFTYQKAIAKKSKRANVYKIAVWLLNLFTQYLMYFSWSWIAVALVVFSVYVAHFIWMGFFFFLIKINNYTVNFRVRIFFLLLNIIGYTPLSKRNV